MLESAQRTNLNQPEPEAVRADFVRVLGPSDVAMADAHVSSKPGAGTARIFYWGIATLPIACLQALLMAASFWTPPAVDTGDKLLDRFFAEYDSRGALPWSSSTLPALRRHFDSWRHSDHRPAQSYSESSILSRTDPAFAGDPRYWLLLARSGHVRPPLEARRALKRRNLSEHVWFLEQARRQATPSAIILMELAYEYDSGWERAAKLARSSTPLPERTETWPVAYWMEQEALYRKAAGAQFEPFLRELIASGPADAGTHYAAARLLASAGLYERALEEIRLGNSCEDGAGFVQPVGRKMWHADNPPTKILNVEQMAFVAFFTRHMSSFIAWKNCTKKLAMSAAKADDRQALQDLHEFACRFARSGTPSTIQNLVGLTLVNLERAALTEFQPATLTPAEYSGLAQLRIATEKVKKSYYTQSQMMAAADPLLFAQEGLARDAWDAAVTLGGEDYAGALQLRSAIRGERFEQGYYEQIIKPLWTPIEQFDYTRLATFATRSAVPSMAEADLD